MRCMCRFCHSGDFSCRRACCCPCKLTLPFGGAGFPIVTSRWEDICGRTETFRQLNNFLWFLHFNHLTLVCAGLYSLLGVAEIFIWRVRTLMCHQMSFPAFCCVTVFGSSAGQETLFRQIAMTFTLNRLDEADNFFHKSKGTCLPENPYCSRRLRKFCPGVPKQA